jgi:MFS family permease
MPSFLSSVYGIPIFQNGIFNALTTLATGIAMLIGGPLSGFILSRTKLSKTRVRKLFQHIALIGPAICIGLVPAVGCDSNVVVVLLVLAMLLYGFITGGEWPVISEFAPDFAGTIFGIANVFAMCTAFVAPYIVGVLLDEDVSIIPEWTNSIVVENRV